ncbi:MAG: PilZ domain-containing protein [Leptospiraceae bacterium]|nr:PilZ domain-containing protein [Leptospiraceae bacterium]
MFKKIFPVSFKNLPKPILLIGFFYLLTPLWSYWATSVYLDIPIFEFSKLFKTFSAFSLTLNFVGFLLGLGILGVKRWGYFLFLGFNFILIGHGLYLLFIKGFQETFILNLVYTLIPFIIILYFLNKEISTPYLTLLPRGFRKKWRTEIPLGGYVILDGGVKMRMVTMDISPTGCLARVEGSVPENSTCTIQLDLDGIEWSARGLWVREEEGNHGFKFLISSHSPEFKTLDKFLTTKLMPRFTTLKDIEIEYASKKFEAEIENISEKGFYISTKERIAMGEYFSFNMKLKGFHFTGIAKVSWENPDGKFDKSPGFGAAFVSISPAWIYSIILFLYELINNYSKRER